MKKSTQFIILLLIFTSCNKDKIKNNTPKKIDGYSIYGTIKSFDGKTIVLQQLNTDKKYNTIQTTTVNDAIFKFQGDLKTPNIYYLGFENSNYKLPIILDDFEVFVDVNISDLDKSAINGSKLQKQFQTYIKGLKNAKNKFVYKTKFIKANSSSPIATMVLFNMLGKNKWRLEQNKKAYQTLSKNNKESGLGLEIFKFIQTYEPKVKQETAVAEFSLNPDIDNSQKIKTLPSTSPKPINHIKPLPKRKKAPNFYAESLNGNDISLNSVRKNAKVTLIDFWASWCGPCRSSNPHLVTLYNKYHKSGFNILSISEDDFNKKHLWKNAIQTDGLKWHHVIDDDGRIANMFGVKGIPHTVLLDANGGIIFTKKTTYTIEKKLKEIFGY